MFTRKIVVFITVERDWLGRSTLEALNTAKDLDTRGVAIVITTLGIDLKTAGGRLVFGLMAQIAEDAVSAVMRSRGARTQELPGFLGVRCYA